MNNIISISKEFDSIFLINDEHSIEDPEFKYLPEHMIEGRDETARINWFEKKLEAPFYLLHKNTLSGVRGAHNPSVIYEQHPKKIFVAGMVASFDILATVFDLTQAGKSVCYIGECITDLTEERKNMAFQQLDWLGISRVPLEKIV